jgi:hypothetical protein
MIINVFTFLKQCLQHFLKKGNNNDGDSGEKKKNQPSKAQLKVAKEFYPYFKLLDQKQYQTSCPVDKSSESVHQFACLLLSIVEGLEIQAVEEYERVAIEYINMLGVLSFQPLGPLRKLSEIQGFLQAARLKTQSSSSFDPLVPLQILLSDYRFCETNPPQPDQYLWQQWQSNMDEFCNKDHRRQTEPQPRYPSQQQM